MVIVVIVLSMVAVLLVRVHHDAYGNSGKYIPVHHAVENGELWSNFCRMYSTTEDTAE